MCVGNEHSLSRFARRQRDARIYVATLIIKTSFQNSSRDLIVPRCRSRLHTLLARSRAPGLLRLPVCSPEYLSAPAHTHTINHIAHLTRLGNDLIRKI